MKKSIIFIAVVVMMGITMAGCYYDEVVGGDVGMPQNVSFSSDVVPIFQKNCNNSGCHDQIPSAKPSLAGDKAYNALLQGGYVNTIAPNQSKLYSSITDGSMPPSGSLSSLDIKIILAWINEGAKNN
jgi:predicted small secreted protein